MEFQQNAHIASVDFSPVDFGSRWQELNTKINTILGNHVLVDTDVRDLYTIVTDLGIQDQWKEMNAKIRAELEGISQHVEEATKVLDANPPELKWRSYTAPIAFARAPVAFAAAPVTVAVAPVAVAEAPVAVAEASVAVAEESVAVAEESVAVAEAEVTVAEAEVTLAEPEVTVVEAPVAEAEAPVAEAEAPATEAAAPVAATAAPVMVMPNFGFSTLAVAPSIEHSYRFEPVVHEEKVFGLNKPMLVSMPWQHWNYKMNTQVASANVKDIIPMKKQVIERRLFGEWDALMEDVAEWHKRGLYRYNVRLCTAPTTLHKVTFESALPEAAQKQ